MRKQWMALQGLWILVNSNNNWTNNNSKTVSLQYLHRHSVNSKTIFNSKSNKETNPYNHKNKLYLHKNKREILISGTEEYTKVGTNFQTINVLMELMANHMSGLKRERNIAK